MSNDPVDVRAELDGDMAHKFQDLQDFLDTRSGKRKYGKANTLRLAVELGHERMRQIKEKERKAMESYQSVKQEMDDKLEDL